MHFDDLALSRPAWVVTGVTGCGKSEFAMRLAEKHQGEIISMDSMTVYRGMDIGTAKPSVEDRRRVPHHLIDELDPWESANVAWWLGRAFQSCREIQQRGKQIIFVGGTPLYLKALLYGLFEGPPADAALRARLEDEGRRYGTSILHRRLQQVDPVSACRIHPNDLRRLVRALEVWEITKRPLSSWQNEWRPEQKSPMLRCWWLDRPREELDRRINERVDRMIQAGWVHEVRRLLQLPRPMSREASQALGYAEIRAVVQGKLDLASAREIIQRKSRQFARRQLTWFRSLPNLVRVPLADDAALDAVIPGATT
jgi:tRNA dimethylallyltransferase